MKRLVVIGGGAAGFFGAIAAAEASPDLEVVLLEKSSHTLSKVRISGGGRCNVTHACFDPRELAGYYPRGHKELLGPFHRFQPGDTIAWFSERGVELKTEDDGRMFPVTDSSATITTCLEDAARAAGVQVRLRSGATGWTYRDDSWVVEVGEEQLRADFLLIATGSSPLVWEALRKLPVAIVEPVPSLFTFNLADARLRELPGVVAPHAQVAIEGSGFRAEGPLLITHWGMSGPAVLRLSAWAARTLAEMNYHFTIQVDWDHSSTPDQTAENLKQLRADQPRRTVSAFSPAGIPVRLWNALLSTVFPPDKRWSDVTNREIEACTRMLHHSLLQVVGKSTFKDEFVTAGGVDLKEVDFRTMEARRFPGLFFAGEVLDIDAVTGGFNFQAAWTTSWIAAQTIAGRC